MRKPGALVAMLVLAGGCRGTGDGPGIRASGHIEATEVRLATKVAGTIESFTVNEGDRVTADQEIARIDATDVRLALAAARAERAQAAVELELRRAGSRPEDIREARAQAERAASEQEAAALDLERMEGLLASGSGTTKSRDDARLRRDVAAANLTAARERLGRVRAGFRREEIEAARARVEAADARIAQLDRQIADAVIKSPIAGVLTEKVVERGELAARGAALAVITDIDRPWLTVYLPGPHLDRIRLGQEAEVVTDSGQRRPARVTFISPQAEFTPKNVQTPDERAKLVYRVKLGLENGDGLFKPGMPAEARLVPAAGAAADASAR